MADVEKQNDDQQEQKQEQDSQNDDSISSLIEQICEQLVCTIVEHPWNSESASVRLRQDDIELTEQLTSLYDNLCHLRQSLTYTQSNSHTDITTIPIQIDSPTASRYLAKPRSDSEPNILSDRQRIITIIDDLQ